MTERMALTTVGEMFLLASLTAVPMTVTASAETGDPRQSSSRTDDASAEPQRLRFQPHEPSHISYRVNRDADDAVNVRSSFSYYVTAPDFEYGSGMKEANLESTAPNGFFPRVWGNKFLFLSYTGEFDLFLTRDSKPVVGREHNPAATVRWVEPPIIARAWKGIRHIDASVQHRSNGQTMGVDELEGRTLEQLFKTNPRSEVFDQISRGLNFVSLGVSGRLGGTDTEPDSATGRCYKSRTCWDVGLRVNGFHWGDEDEVTWGDGDGAQSIAEYERLRVIVSKTMWFGNSGINVWWLNIPTFTLTLTTVVGDALKPSFDISADLPIRFTMSWLFQNELTVPLFFELHNGPMAYLSDYTRPMVSMAIGLRIHG